uniref:DDRGK domain-containing protein 1 n=1 Tax=Panagrolaimus sp. ES5 TaxID=591445 RepID=A0AC34F6G3_9BILA
MEAASNTGFLYAAIAFLFAVFSIIGGFVFKLYNDEKNARERARAAQEMLDGEERPNRRAPQRRHVFNESEEEEDGGEYDDDDATGFGSGEKKMGKKKLAKLQAKAEARAAREAELAEREERKKREEEKNKQLEEIRRQQDAEEKAQEEKEKAEQEERERKEHEEYLKLKASFQVEEEGFDAKSEEEKENLLKDFVDYIKKTKVVNVDELAAKFKLDVPAAVEKIKYFIENDILTGVIDDRGKFIYIAPEELEAVARFINQRGRISLFELASYSNQLISLKSLDSIVS